MTIRRAIVIAVVCLVFLATGIVVDWKGFIGNVAAGAIEIVVTVTIIDWLLRQQRRKRWQRVRSQIISALTQHIGNIVTEYMINFHGPELRLLDFSAEIGEGYLVPKPQTANALRSMVENMEQAPVPEDSRALAEQLHSAIQWDITQIRSSLLPRIIDIECDEPELVSLLGEFDNADRRWVNQRIIDKAVAAGNQYSAAIDVLREATCVYEYLVGRCAG
jgi:hypothetical protein